MKETSSVAISQGVVEDKPNALRDRSGAEDSPCDRNGKVPFSGQRVRVDGKFFARDARRPRVQGVPSGPFAPNPEGEPFPVPERVTVDFAFMQATGINAVRTYHVPPDWFLNQADEHGMGTFVDIPWPKHLCFL